MKTRCVNFLNHLLEKAAYAPEEVGSLMPKCKWTEAECAALKDDLIKRLVKPSGPGPAPGPAPAPAALVQQPVPERKAPKEHAVTWLNGPRGPQPDFITEGGMDESIYGWCDVMYDMMRKKAIEELAHEQENLKMAKEQPQFLPGIFEGAGFKVVWCPDNMLYRTFIMGDFQIFSNRKAVLGPRFQDDNGGDVWPTDFNAVEDAWQPLKPEAVKAMQKACPAANMQDIDVAEKERRVIPPACFDAKIGQDSLTLGHTTTCRNIYQAITFKQIENEPYIGITDPQVCSAEQRNTKFGDATIPLKRVRDLSDEENKKCSQDLATDFFD